MEMTDRPILFSSTMIRALLAGTKTQTRRLIKPQPIMTASGRWKWEGKTPGAEASCFFGDEEFISRSLLDDVVKYAVGDRLWVREAWNIAFTGELALGETIERTSDECAAANRGFACPVGHGLVYKATGFQNHLQYGNAVWRSPLHLPRYGSRLTLTVTEVRVQRLQEISEADAMAEGIDMDSSHAHLCANIADAGWPNDLFKGSAEISVFRALWDSINAKRAPWDSNPWVVALTFTVQRGNIDALAAEIKAGG